MILAYIWLLSIPVVAALGFAHLCRYPDDFGWLPVIGLLPFCMLFGPMFWLF